MGEQSSVSRAVLYGSRPPANDSVWRAAEAQGFEVVVYDRNAANREKKIDTKIVTDLIGDFVPAAQRWRRDHPRRRRSRLRAGR